MRKGESVNELLSMAASITAIGVLLVALKKVFVFTKKTIYLVDEVVGDEANDKVGVIKRVTIIEGKVETLEEYQARCESECKHKRREI